MEQNQKGLYGSSLGGNMLRVGVAEFLGTFFLVLAGTATATAAILNKSIAGSAADSLAVALAFGLVLVALIGALGHISGAHFNPAVTISLAVTNKFPWKYVPVYLVTQLVGAVAASAIVLYLFGDAARSVAFMGATFPAMGVSMLQVVVIEALITFLLVLVIISVATDERVSSPVVGPAIGFTLIAAVLIGGPISGGAVNPARALGPMIIAGKFTGWWAYIVGPIIGGVCTALLYDHFIAEAKQPKE
jgi:MIP family channel proteins